MRFIDGAGVVHLCATGPARAAWTMTACAQPPQETFFGLQLHGVGVVVAETVISWLQETDAEVVTCLSCLAKDQPP